MGYQVSWAWPCRSSGLLGTEPLSAVQWDKSAESPILGREGILLLLSGYNTSGAPGADLVWVSSHSFIFTNPTSRGKKNEIKIHSTLIPAAPGEMSL